MSTQPPPRRYSADRAVFVDESGRRAAAVNRGLQLLAALSALALAAVLVSTLAGVTVPRPAAPRALRHATSFARP